MDNLSTNNKHLSPDFQQVKVDHWRKSNFQVLNSKFFIPPNTICILLRMLFNTLLSFLFPPFCAGCRRVGRSICPICLSALQPTVVDICPYCYNPSRWGRTHDRCIEKGGLDGAVACVRYNQIARNVVKCMKYSFITEVFTSLEKQLPSPWWRIEEVLDMLGSESVLQPIPLHTKRLKKRGFNQSQLIASFLSKRSNLFIIDALKRVKNTEPQARQISREARRINIHGAFVVTKSQLVKNRTIILIDDIFTSGSTAKEAAKTLKLAGAQKVYLYAFAHGK